jgi:hypothetical protein
MKEAGLGGMTDIEKARLTAQLQNQQIQQSADIASAQLAESAAGRAESASSANAALQERALTDQYGLQLQNNQQGINLYGTTPAATALASQNILNNQQLSQSGQQNLINSRISAGALPGKGQSTLNAIGQGLGMVSQIGSGLGTIGNVFGGGPTPSQGMGLPTVPLPNPSMAGTYYPMSTR